MSGNRDARRALSAEMQGLIAEELGLKGGKGKGKGSGGGGGLTGGAKKKRKKGK